MILQGCALCCVKKSINRTTQHWSTGLLARRRGQPQQQQEAAGDREPSFHASNRFAPSSRKTSTAQVSQVSNLILLYCPFRLLPPALRVESEEANEKQVKQGAERQPKQSRERRSDPDFDGMQARGRAGVCRAGAAMYCSRVTSHCGTPADDLSLGAPTPSALDRVRIPPRYNLPPSTRIFALLLCSSSSSISEPAAVAALPYYCQHCYTNNRYKQ